MESLFIFDPLVKNQQDVNSLLILPVSPNHIFMLDNLPMHHSDPFDRLLISQAIEEKLLLVSKDEKFSDYAVKLFW
ncbi:MAG: type II toxin-antitoxin system VapC family toxin [Thermodesulfobacteriota bacterium]|nr:type II toxin-antitoxin system VapC family toxin [Thermodesulfobacteriota bacterium]